MGITLKPGSMNVIPGAVREFRDRVDKATLYYFQYYGELLVKYARDKHTYTDRTGNLTNSIGYVVVKDGKVVSSGGMDGSGEAQTASMEVINQIISQTTSQYTLIVVAGMNYAAYVEAKGYNVLLPAELKAKLEMPDGLERLKQLARSKAQQMFNL
jgi:hypothetical protein